MLFLRSAIFNLFLPLWTCIICIIVLPFAPFFGQKAAGIAGRTWGRGLQVAVRILCGITVEVRGRERLPELPYIVASKHQSALETIMFWVLLRHPIYVLKKELLSVPVLGQFMRFSRMIAIDRSAGASALKQMVRDVEDRLSQGFPVVIFPEGTRTAIGEKAEYQPGVAALYANKAIQVPVVPVALNSGVCWGKESFVKTPGKVIIEFLEPIQQGLGRKEFMEQLYNAVETKTAELVEEVVSK